MVEVLGGRVPLSVKGHELLARSAVPGLQLEAKGLGEALRGAGLGAVQDEHPVGGQLLLNVAPRLHSVGCGRGGRHRSCRPDRPLLPVQKEY